MYIYNKLEWFTIKILVCRQDSLICAMFAMQRVSCSVGLIIQHSDVSTESALRDTLQTALIVHQVSDLAVKVFELV